MYIYAIKNWEYFPYFTCMILGIQIISPTQIMYMLLKIKVIFPTLFIWY